MTSILSRRPATALGTTAHVRGVTGTVRNVRGVTGTVRNVRGVTGTVRNVRGVTGTVRNVSGVIVRFSAGLPGGGFRAVLALAANVS